MSAALFDFGPGRRALADAQRRAHDIAQVVDIQRFGNEIKGAGLERDNGGFHVAVCGDHGTGQLRMLFLDIADQVDAIAVR